MRLARLIPLLLLGACSTTKSSVPLEAPDVRFKKAFIVAAVGPEYRKDIEDHVAAEIQRRRPYVQVIPSFDQFPNPNEVREHEFISFLKSHDIDLVVTIVPFAETYAAKYDEWDDVAESELGTYVEGMDTQALVGRYGVQVVGWDVATKHPVYAKTRQVMVGEVSGPNGVIEFTADTVTRDI